MVATAYLILFLKVEHLIISVPEDVARILTATCQVTNVSATTDSTEMVKHVYQSLKYPSVDYRVETMHIASREGMIIIAHVMMDSSKMNMDHASI